MAAMWAGIPSDRVVAVVASLDTGLVQIGSGYLVAGHRVLTARHCARDERTGRPATSLRVQRRSGGPDAPATLAAIGADLDVAVLEVGDEQGWAIPADLEPPRFGRVDRSHTGELHDCEAVGFPLWQLDPRDHRRNAAELRGTIRVTEDMESGFLVMRDPALAGVGGPGTAGRGEGSEGSLWGGLSGALVFCQGLALGVVVEHHPRQGGSAIRILPAERFAAPGAGGDPDIAAVAVALGLPAADELPLASTLPPARTPPLAGLVEVALVDGRLPRVPELNPYTLGATPSEYGNAETYGQRDEYVPRTQDGTLAAALRPGRVVVLIGPSKVGKTRTAFEALRRHDDWSGALLAAPAPRSIDSLAAHPAVGGSEPMVIWLDDLQRFLPPAGQLSRAAISQLVDRPGPTILVATLRTEQRELLRVPGGELTREMRVVLDNANSIELASTRDDADEQLRAEAAYPQVGSRPDGLAETLAGAPELLRQYRGSAAASPALHMLVQTCVDWARCGLARPLPEAALLAIARKAFEEDRPFDDLTEEEMGKALRLARTPFAAGGQVALIGTSRLPDRSRGYEAFDYLVAADDGQGEERARAVTPNTWRWFLDEATDEDAFAIGAVAMQRGNIDVAVAATRRAADAGVPFAQFNLGTLLATMPGKADEARALLARAAEEGNILADFNLDSISHPAGFGRGDRHLVIVLPDDSLAEIVRKPFLAGDRARFLEAAEAGDIDAQFALGLLHAQLDPPEMDEARAWYTRAAAAGNTDAQVNLGVLLAELDPPDLAGARTWWTRAAEAGNSDAQLDLARLLADLLDPPDLAAARGWLIRAAEAGSSDAQLGLARLLADHLDPPELAQARAWYTRAAEAGNSDAQLGLGRLLAARLDPPELEEARTWLTRAAKQENTDAQVVLGQVLANLLDPPQLDEARGWYTRAAEAGDITAQVNLGVLLATRLDPPELAGARAWYTRAAEAGNSTAQVNLGLVLTGQLDPPDLAEARIWWTKAAESGNTDAQVNLAWLLADGLDPPERAQARAWYTRAAEAGHTGAQVRLGWLLETELDPPELTEARAWYTRAAQAGDADAQFSLGRLLEFRLDPPELTEARAWYARAAEAGNTDAQINLGALLVTADPPELGEARAWWTRAADAGDTRAQGNLGRLASMLDPPQLEEARAWYTRAAEAGDAQAQFSLGLLLADQMDPPELAEARIWYTRAAEAGNTDAQTNLGWLLAANLDPPELTEARSWLARASEAGNTTAQAILGWLLAYMVDPPDLAEARIWLTRAAEAGNADAQHNLAMLLADQPDP
jgi:TPR repeat protein